MRATTVMLSALAIASSATAQQRSLAAYDLPREVHRHLTRIVDDPATRRFEGASVIAADQSIGTAVVAFDGPLTVAGKIDGELVIVGGDVEFQEGASVSGDVTVIGGQATGVELAHIGGTFTTYSEGFELYHRGERILSVNTRRRRGERRDYDYERNWGHSSFAVRTGTNYNRVEGLPILIGPVIQTGGRNPTRVEALGILRTGSGDLFDSDRMGYQLRVEQFITSAFRVGATARSVIDPIEDWNLTNLEASLATFVLHEDQRDYFEREGWGVYARFNPLRSPLNISAGYWDEDHTSKGVRDPWTLFGDGGWRQQPLVGEGRLRSLVGQVELDRRNNKQFPSSGVYFSGSLTHGLDGTLAVPSWGGESLTLDQAPRQLDQNFNAGLLDLRLYRRVGVDATLALRGVAGGSLDDNQGLPPQFQHALGGAGTLPGYRLLSADCGARSALVFRQGQSNRSYFPQYGCDRFALGSIEYRGGFDLDFGGDFDFWGHTHEDWGWNVDAKPSWMMFFNAGQGWALGDSRELGAVDTGMLYDAGAGIVLGDLGIYAAVPLNGEKRGVNFFVRLGARF